MRRLLPLTALLVCVLAAAASAATPHLSPTAYTTITRLYGLLDAFDAPATDQGAALRRAVCDRLPEPGDDRQARLVLADCTASADALDPMTAAMACASPSCVREPAAEAAQAAARSHRAEAALAATVSGACHTLLAADARHTGAVAAAWRSIARAAQAGSQAGVLKGFRAFVDASMAGEGFAKRLPTCAP